MEESSGPCSRRPVFFPPPFCTSQPLPARPKTRQNRASTRYTRMPSIRRRPLRRRPSADDTVWKPAPPTDPKLTHELWTAVSAMSTRSSSRQEAGKGRARRTRQGADRTAEEIPPSEPSTIADTPPTTELETASVAESKITTRSKRPRKMPGPRETGFLDAVLRPHGVDIDLTVKPSLGAFQYFGTDSNTNYSELEGLGHIRIWLDTAQANRVDITAEYKEMRRLKLCEDEFATFAKENLLKGPRRADPVNEDERFRIQRLVNPSLMPDAPSHWEQPPCMEDGPQWSWDVRPDCSYWLSLRGFNEDWQAEIQGVTYVKKNVACPYFTTEFKRDDDPTTSISPAINQVASAGCIALYNRFCLWRSALNSKFTHWTPTPFSEIRHFGLTFVGGSFSVWVLKPVQSEDGGWAGCTMERLGGGDCEDSAHSTGKLMEWINEFHRWGLTVHGPACKAEIKVCLKGAGLRTSTIGLEQEGGWGTSRTADE